MRPGRHERLAERDRLVREVEAQRHRAEEAERARAEAEAVAERMRQAATAALRALRARG